MSLPRAYICPNCFAGEMVNGKCSSCGFEAETAKEHSLMLPYFTLLNQRYVTGRVIGAGGFGITYVATDRKSANQLCAVKEYLPMDLVSGRDQQQNLVVINSKKSFFQDGCQDFLTEAKTQQRLASNITVVDVTDFFAANGTVYMVMELLQGATVRERFRASKDRDLKQRQFAYAVLLSIASAMVEVHRANILRLDISPENIFITDSGDIKLLDFGASRPFKGYVHTGSRTIMLKPGFSPPEQYSAQGNLGPWTDVYALASTYYFMVSGLTILKAKERYDSDDIPRLFDMKIGVSRHISEVIDCALAADIGQRIKSMGELLEALEPSAKIEETAATTTDGIGKTRAFIKNGREKISEVLNSAKQGIKPKSSTQKRQNQAVQKPTWSAPPSVIAPKPAEKQYHYSLEMLRGPYKGNKWLIVPDAVYKIGRSGQNNIIIAGSNSISRTHCLLKFDSVRDCFLVQDCSSNGTFFAGGQRLNEGTEYKLYPDDMIYLATDEYLVRMVRESQ